MLTVYILKIQLSNLESSQLPSAPPLVTWLTFASWEFSVPLTFLDSSSTSRLSWTPFGPLHGCSLTCYCISSGRKLLELQGNFKATFWKFQCVSFQSPAFAKSPSNVERIWYERVQLGRRLPFLLQHDYHTMFSKPSSKHLEPSFTDKECLNNCPTLVVLKIPGAMTWTVEESVKSKGDIPIGSNWNSHTHTHICSRKSFHFAAANPRWLIRSSKSLIWDKGLIKTHSPEVLYLRQASVEKLQWDLLLLCVWSEAVLQASLVEVSPPLKERIGHSHASPKAAHAYEKPRPNRRRHHSCSYDTPCQPGELEASGLSPVEHEIMHSDHLLKASLWESTANCCHGFCTPKRNSAKSQILGQVSSYLTQNIFQVPLNVH